MARFLEDQKLLDKKTNLFKGKDILHPKTGWIRTIRTALRMSQAELATLLEMNQKSLHALEASEASMRIRLDSLVKVANALDCELVYAFVPRTPLTDRYTDRALAIAAAQLAGVENTMHLENQAVTFNDSAVKALANKLIEKDAVHWSVDV